VKERESRGHRSRVRTWASSQLRGRSKEPAGDTPPNGKPKDDEDLETNEKRDETPPARRGGPEMNGISGMTGEQLDTGTSDDEGESAKHEPNANTPQGVEKDATQGITFRGDTRFGPNRSTAVSHSSSQRIRRTHSNIFSLQGVGARPMSSLRTSTSLDFQSLPSLQRSQTAAPPKHSRKDISKYFDTAAGWVARNSQFHGLSEDERERLGGCEYRAVAFLEWLVPIYFVLWQLLGCIGCGAWVALNMPNTARENGINPWWVGAFNAVSAFNNS
jgi:hypothetical protein